MAPMARTASLAVALSGCGLALGIQLKGQSTFLSQADRRAAGPWDDPKWDDPKWDKNSVQHNGGDTGYHADYPKDARPNVTDTNVPWTHVTVDAPSDGHAQFSMAWYQAECKKINAHCVFIQDHRTDSVREDLRYLEDEYIRQRNLLGEKKEKVVSEKDDIQRVLAEMAAAKVTIEENSHCPAELATAKSDLKVLQAVNHTSSSSIDKECEVEKEVIKWQACVDELRAAEALLIKHTESLPKQQRQEVRAKKKIPDQEDAVKEAKARWLEAKGNGVDPSVHSVEDNCDAERDALMRKVNVDMRDLWDEYIRQKGILEDKEVTHKTESREVRHQKEDVVEATTDLAEAEAVVKENLHCEPKLKDAEARLASMVAVPDRSSADIDRECETEKDVIKWKACVVVLKKAQKVLADHRVVHGAETADLEAQEEQAHDAKIALPPQEKVVDDAYEAWLRAKALRDQSNCYPKDD